MKIDPTIVAQLEQRVIDLQDQLAAEKLDRATNVGERGGTACGCECSQGKVAGCTTAWPIRIITTLFGMQLQELK